jgi:hypothetical protein
MTTRPLSTLEFACLTVAVCGLAFITTLLLLDRLT